HLEKTLRIFRSAEELAQSEGVELGTTDWLTVDQKRINRFADATGDHQWIHVDPERAASGPYGGTIAHGLLTLSLLPQFLHPLYRVDGVRMAINYGLNKVRFPAPVPVGSRLRARSRVAEVTRMEGAVQAVLATTLEVEGAEKPAAVIESIVRYVE